MRLRKRYCATVNKEFQQVVVLIVKDIQVPCTNSFVIWSIINREGIDKVKLVKDGKEYYIKNMSKMHGIGIVELEVVEIEPEVKTDYKGWKCSYCSNGMCEYPEIMDCTECSKCVEEE